MNEVTTIETNFSSGQIKKVKPFINCFYFDGGYLYYKVTDKDLNKVKSLLGKSIIDIKKVS